MRLTRRGFLDHVANLVMLIERHGASLGAVGFERAAYAYELLDPERDLRRAFHLHDPEWFMARFLVLTHEHCEQPIGHARCAHLHGQPVRDAYRGIELLMAAWLDEVDCTSLPCLE
jgi:hypothetical protein